MTISSQTSRISYTGNSSTTAFSVPFYFAANADIVVYLTSTAGTQTLQVLGTDYTLTGATVDGGGTCTFVTAPTTGYIVAIYRDPALTQTTSYNNNDPFPAASHEAALDKALTIDQRTRDLVTRSIHLADGETTIDTALPAVAVRKNTVLGFDTDGTLEFIPSDLITPGSGSSFPANPTGTIGLSAVNGVETNKFLRSDGAPALSQAIAPTWTALHTYTLNNGGWTSAGTPHQTGTYLGPTQKFGIIASATGADAGPNKPETTMLVNMTATAGSSDPVNSFKTAFGAVITANSGAGDAWAQSNVVNLGLGNARGGIALELDLNNFSGISHGSTPTTPYIGNLALAGQNTDGVSTHGYAHYALGIHFAQNSTPMWNYGIYMGHSGFNVFNTAGIFDETNSTYGYLLAGTKTTGIDMSGCTTSNAMFINNNSFVIGYNAARGATYTLLGVDTGNHICIGDGSSAYISSRQSINPSADNTYTLGIAGNRWNAVWAANGTIQTSDRRAKTDIESLPAALPIVMAVDPKTYRWKDGGGRHWGVIAQDLDAAIEKTGVEFAGINKDDPDHWGLNYAETNAILWKAVQELAAEVERLRDER